MRSPPRTGAVCLFVCHIICGKISYVSGIAALSVAAQRDLWGKSPRALISPSKQTVPCGRMITFAIRKSSCKPACGTLTFARRCSQQYAQKYHAPSRRLRFEGAYHFWCVIKCCEERKPCAPLTVASRIYSLASQKYHFFGVDIARLFFFLYPQKNITIFMGRYPHLTSVEHILHILLI